MKKIISIILTMLMLISMVAVAIVPASAADGDWAINSWPHYNEEASADEVDEDHVSSQLG